MAKTKSGKPAKQKTDLRLAAGAGHNSGKVIPEVQTILSRIIKGDEDKKAISRSQRDDRNLLKEKFGISAGVVSHEIKLQKMDADVRIQFEAGHHDLKVVTGYQAQLDLKEGTIARTEEEFVDPGDPEAEANKLALKR